VVTGTEGLYGTVLPYVYETRRTFQALTLVCNVNCTTVNKGLLRKLWWWRGERCSSGDGLTFL